MTRNPSQQRLAVVAVLVHLVVTSFVWRDIGRRPVGALRGGATLWRVLTALNTGNSLVYLLLGRRR